MNIITEDSHQPAQRSSVQSHTSSVIMSSPANSVFSRGHASKGSGSSSSLASSPIPRDSFDLYGSRLGKVTEEPQEKHDSTTYSLADDDTSADDSCNQFCSSDQLQALPISVPHGPEYSFGDDGLWDTGTSQRYLKRQRASETPPNMSNRLSTRFNSISRRWRNRSAASPQLSIVTHISAPGSRIGSASSSQIMSPALSAISRYESYLPPSPTRTNLDDSIHGSDAFSIPELPTQEEDVAPATTPLLPPVLTELDKHERPVHSPLQSPSIAPTQPGLNARVSLDAPGINSLPSPPLSTKPSLVSIRQRSRGNTGTGLQLGEVPALQMLDEHRDPWASRLGHADFSIHPEPYLPGVVDMDSYIEFRANWDQARTSYAKHLARTVEHYGSTSKVFKLTEEKWSFIDQSWKDHNNALTKTIAPLVAKTIDQDTPTNETAPSDIVLEKPVTRIIIPTIDDTSGKFPELGDSDIIGPMEVGPPRSAAMRRSPPHSPTSTRKRNLLKFLHDMFARA